MGEGGFHQFLKVNRLDLQHVRKGDSLIVPVRAMDRSPRGDGPSIVPAGQMGTTVATASPVGDSLYFAPFPQSLAGLGDQPKHLLISIRVQAYAAYEGGRLVRWGPTSTGRKETPTPARLYHVNWKDKDRISTVNEEWHLTWVVNLDNLLGVSIHQYELPGRPASHSCVRLLEEDARWLYGWAEQWTLSPDGSTVLAPGTPVLVFGAYAYGKRPPWKRLPEDPMADFVPVEEIETALESAARP